MITSAVRRFVKLGGLAGRVGASVIGSQILDVARSGPSKQIKKTENLVHNAARIVETLGEMKGAAMKIGQMLSLHDGMLPPEVAEVLRGLQQEAPKVPAEVMEFEIRGALDNFDELFESLDFEAFAAASIGQVHRGRLAGRPRRRGEDSVPADRPHRRGRPQESEDPGPDPARDDLGHRFRSDLVGAQRPVDGRARLPERGGQYPPYDGTSR